MSHLRPIPAVLVFVLLTSACGSSRYTVIEPPKQPLHEFTVLEIRDFTSVLSDPDSSALASRFPDQLYAAVIKDRTEHPGESSFEQVVRGDTGSGNVLVLDGKVISFEKGSRAKRYFLGFGAGKAFCTIRSTFTDKASGELVLESDFDGELSMSLFGGSAEEAVEAVVRAYIDYFRASFANPSARSN